jgi:hypothetical protein
MAALYNIVINNKEDIANVEIIFTAFCCGYGKMEEEISMEQILKGINDFSSYEPMIIDTNTRYLQPNMHEQPKYYQNTEWYDINCNEIVNV